MTQLPAFLRLAPAAFYLAALIYFIGSVTLTYIQISSVAPGSGEEVHGMYRAAILQGWLFAFFGGVVLAGLGIVIRILLTISPERRAVPGPGVGND